MIRRWAFLAMAGSLAGLLNACASRVAPDGDGGGDAPLGDARVGNDGTLPVGDASPGTDAVIFPDAPPMMDARPPSDVSVFPDAPPAMDVPPGVDVPPVMDVRVMPDVPPGVDAPLPRDVPPAVDAPLGMDVPPAMDVPPGVDVPPAMDVPPGVDVPPAMDVPLGMDVPPGVDVPVPTDARDASPPPDASPPSIVGRWRVVRYDFAQNGTPATLTDQDSPFPIGGGVFIDARVNGELFITGSRLAETFGVLLNDHFYVNDMAMNAQSASSAYGVVVAGSVQGSSFTFLGGSLQFRYNADGTITQVDTTNNTAITWARASAGPAVATYSGAGQAAFYHASTATPIARPRLVLAWDRPGTNTGAVYSNDVPITFGPFNTAQYNLTVNSPPTAAVGSLGGTSVAIAYVIVYDDTNGSGAFELGTDAMRGLSNVALVWRAGAASTAFDTSSFRDADEGFQLVELAADYSTGRVAPEPWDWTNAVAPDIVLSPTVDARPIPDILR